mgnify:CR=1 FL=1
MKKNILITTSFSRAGANSLTKLLKTKYNCAIIKLPYYDEKRGMWKIHYEDSKLK